MVRKLMKIFIGTTIKRNSKLRKPKIGTTTKIRIVIQNVNVEIFTKNLIFL